ncbi:hypothetical protein ACJMK2_003102 [Sinanodonta woodiana]|uniref:Death domain-containing protein n=1 Tax=Sinanodonta woodiana TaxID=1069815 RepID=A0ABD3Y0E1_SINWO
MEDIEAIRLLTKEIQNIQSIPNPPPGYDGIQTFDKKTTEVIDHAVDTTQKVDTYAEGINAKLEEMQSALNQSTKNIEEQIKKAVNVIGERFLEGRDEAKGSAVAQGGTLLPNKGIVGTNSKQSSKDMEYMLMLQNLEMKKQRLQEFIIKTQQILEKIKQGVRVTNSDIEQLKGCLASWLENKKESYQNEQDRLENERKHQEEEERKRKKEEEEKARKRKEDDENKRTREEDLTNKENEKQLKRETEESQQKERVDMERKKEEERVEMERNRKEEERVEMERKRKEEEDRTKREAKTKEEEERKRRDPANWTPHTYRRSDGESDTFHHGICCQVFAMPETLEEEDLECLASDEWRDNGGPTLAIGEKVASSLTEVKVKEVDKDLKLSMRICVPHCSVYDSSDEVIVKASIDGREWKNKNLVTVPARHTNQPDLNYAGIVVDKFHTLKMLAVAKTRSQELVVDKNGISQALTLDKNIKLFVPKDTFRKSTKMNLQIRPIRDNSLTFATQYYDHCHNVLSTSSVMAITCEALTEKDIELCLKRNAPKDKITSFKSKHLNLYKCKGDNWNIAEIENKQRKSDFSIKLPSRKDSYVVMAIEGKSDIPNEEFSKAADELFFHSNASIVQVVATKRADNPSNLMIQCVRRDQVSSRLSELERQGYNLITYKSEEFTLLDGQAITVWCSGNIAMTPKSAVKLIFHAYMDTAKQEVTLQAKDEYRQKDFDEYLGHLEFEVLKDKRQGALYIKSPKELSITLCKRAKERLHIVRAPIRFPHYLTTLAKFLAMKLTIQAKDDTWQQVICSLGSPIDNDYIRRRAPPRSETPNSECEICEIILQDWMKSKLIQEDKIDPILAALQDCDLSILSGECEKLVNIHMKYLSDECISEMAKKIANDWSSLARKLGLSEEEIASCKSGSKGSNEDEAYIMLCKWRVSEAVVNSGIDVFNELLRVLETVQNFDDLQEYVRHTSNMISKD